MIQRNIISIFCLSLIISSTEKSVKFLPKNKLLYLTIPQITRGIVIIGLLLTDTMLDE